MAPTLSAKCGEWFVESLDEGLKGPYRTAAIALQVALTDVVRARRRGQPANLSVRDSQNVARDCKLIKKPVVETCFECETSWPKGQSSLPPRCPLWEAFRALKD
jgi:hypothetical protein